MNNFVTLHNIQHTSGNRPLKGPGLGSADKYTTLLLSAWPIKPVFQLQFFRMKQLFAEFSLTKNLFQKKKVGSNPTFYHFRTKKSICMKKFASGKPALRLSVSTGILQILSKYPSHPAYNFEATKWHWMNFQMQVA